MRAPLLDRSPTPSPLDRGRGALRRGLLAGLRARWLSVARSRPGGAWAGPGAPPLARLRTRLGAATALAGALAGCYAAPTSTASATDADGRAAIELVLRAQEAAWNRGDIAEFMALGYWRSPELTFFSGGEDSRGYQPMLDRYLRKYQAPGQDPGKLSFTRLEVVPLAQGVALARGRWDLDFAAQPDAGGLFSLVVRRTESGWRIVHDHTSVDG
ncbi:MAG: nuclear transport factor 2 family protein [Planctomycetes bacterium]|nr:nuclear transport factor 2 family protein [Planctomycetota bacterium]